MTLPEAGINPAAVKGVIFPPCPPGVGTLNVPPEPVMEKILVSVMGVVPVKLMVASRSP